MDSSILKLPDLPVPVLDTISTDRDRLVEDYAVPLRIFELDLSFTIFAGFEHDRATVPWFLWWLYDRSSFGRKATLVHDFLYELINAGKPLILKSGERVHVPKVLADTVFFLICLMDGIEPQVALRGFLAVWFGGRPGRSS